jgi:hypothetical protein
MAKRNFENLVLNVRLDSKQRALQESLLVPWQQLEHSAAAYAEWHTFLLWTRAISESAGEVPEIVRSELRARCPGFLQWERRERMDDHSVWKSLDQWVMNHHFAQAKADGWFNALMYYAYKDLRTEQAWSLWERTKTAWRQNRPARWPSLEEWTADVLATRTLTHEGTDKARAVEAMAKVEPGQFRKAVSDLLEWRAFTLWVDCVSKPKQPLDELVLNELRNRCPGILTADSPAPLWLTSLFSRLVRADPPQWRVAARAGGWYPALRYHVVHHPRYQRLIHYQQHCNDEWLWVRPISYPSFAEWLSAADAYFIASRVAR